MGVWINLENFSIIEDPFTNRDPTLLWFAFALQAEYQFMFLKVKKRIKRDFDIKHRGTRQLQGQNVWCSWDVELAACRATGSLLNWSTGMWIKQIGTNWQHDSSLFGMDGIHMLNLPIVYSCENPLDVCGRKSGRTTKISCSRNQLCFQTQHLGQSVGSYPFCEVL